MIVARNMWKLWRIGGINLTVETANPERERERERERETCPVSICYPKISTLFGEVPLRRGVFGRPMRICVWIKENLFR